MTPWVLRGPRPPPRLPSAKRPPAPPGVPPRILDSKPADRHQTFLHRFFDTLLQRREWTRRALC